ncbi:EF-hand domain-containing protein [Chloropicon primus]|uniref:EF-hand domain-containing protein n=1 Tax=Chloropicon primus TaxID=1764295 RepID=A0A5B8MQK6_9CHLO|nr:hypothetical protein A3770_07p48120 [Chloropicon primus]UPR01510.1 EF-hand domain-containing protein [Chloropicon primus]|eukprot:QDZ22294.1 hypothetical protein A3770_07p48120 [Chloropicon primus]
MSASGRALVREKQIPANLKRVFEIMDTDADGKISQDDLLLVTEHFGYKIKPAEAEEIIWEVDEDCDKMVSWQEFTDMYDRCRKDKTGCEPKRLYFIVEFMIIDKDNGGEISVEEAIEDLYLQHGKEDLDDKLSDMFGDIDVNDPEAVLDLEKFVSAMRLGQLKQMREKTINKTKHTSSTLKKSSKTRY